MPSHSLFQKILNVAVIAMMLFAFTAPAAPDSALAQNPSRRIPALASLEGVDFSGILPASISHQSFMSKLGGSSEVADLSALGSQRVPVSVLLDMPGLVSLSKAADGAQRAAYVDQVNAYQKAVGAQIEAAGGKVIYQFRNLSSGLIVDMPGSAAEAVAKVPGVVSISRIYDYQVDLSDSVPFIGADAVKAAGFTGAGVKVAVLDSGIDYTHLAFRGPGTVADWEKAYYGSDPACKTALGRVAGCANSEKPDPALFGPFSMTKVKGGYDFVGPVWPSGDLMPDMNPIANRGDTGTGDNGTHGTHVADIIGGDAYPAENGHPAKGEGVAPGVDLYAFTVCSGVSTSCSGVAMLQGLDAAADLDGNPFTYDPADVVNMSLGASYGQKTNNATYYTNQLVSYGTIVVASAGNSSDRPYIVGSPSNASGAISVAQTAMPTETAFTVRIDSPAAIAGILPAAVLQPWSPAPTVKITGSVQYGDGAGGNKNGCAPFAPGSLAGKVVLVDRGTCSFSIKGENISIGGAALGLIGLITPEVPFTGAYGGGVNTVPIFMIRQVDSTAIKNNITAPVVMTVDPSEVYSFANTITGSSSRGPRSNDTMIKPDIGAPGASVSAIAGTGGQTEGFGGTSGAAPMVTGVAALMKQVYGSDFDVYQYKALLMNSANRYIYQDRTGGTPELIGSLVPVTRIGAGQVDAAKALKTRLLAWDATDSDPLTWTGSLSFGYQPVSEVTTITRKLHIQSLYPVARTIYLSNEFRYGDDEDMGVTVELSKDMLTLQPNETVEVLVNMTLDPEKLRAWFDSVNWSFLINRGSKGADGSAFSTMEVDGYLTAEVCAGTDCIADISVPWHVLPKPVTQVKAAATLDPDKATFDNADGLTASNIDLLSLVGEDEQTYPGLITDNCASIGAPEGCELNLPDIKDIGVWADRTANFTMFGISLWNDSAFSGEFPVELDVYIDANRDGTPDFVVFNADQTFQTGIDGRNLVFVYNLAKQTITGYYYTDSTFNSNNFIFYAPASVLSLTNGAAFDFYVLAFESYFTGNLTDCAPKNELGECEGVYTYTTGNDVFVPDLGSVTVGKGETAEVGITVNAAVKDSQYGLLALYREGAAGAESVALPLNASDLKLTGTVAEVSKPGEPVKFNLQVSNTSIVDFTDVVVTATLPEGVSFNATVSDGRCTAAGQVVTCNLGSVLARADSWLVIAGDVDLTVKNGTVLTLTASVTAKEVDDDPTNNSATLKTKIAFYVLYMPAVENNP